MKVDLSALKKICEDILKLQIHTDYKVRLRNGNIYITVEDNLKMIVEVDRKNVIIWCQVLRDGKSRAYKSVVIYSMSDFAKEFENCVWWGLGVVRKWNRR